MEDMERVRLKKLAEVHQPAYLSAVGVSLSAPTIMVHCFRGGEMMTYRTDAAKTLNDHRNVPKHLALDKALEAAEFDNMEACLFYFAGFVQVGW